MQHFGLEENTFEGWFSLETTGHCENLWCGFDFNHHFGGLNYPLLKKTFQKGGFHWNREGILRIGGMVLILCLGLEKHFRMVGCHGREKAYAVISVPVLFQKS